MHGYTATMTTTLTLVIGWNVSWDQVQHGQDAKLTKLVNTIQQVEHYGAVQRHAPRVGHDFIQYQDAVGYHR